MNSSYRYLWPEATDSLCRIYRQMGGNAMGEAVYLALVRTLVLTCLKIAVFLMQSRIYSHKLAIVVMCLYMSRTSFSYMYLSQKFVFYPPYACICFPGSGPDYPPRMQPAPTEDHLFLLDYWLYRKQ